MRYVCALLLSLTALASADPALPTPKHGNTFVVAHRGAHQNIPENTLAAYRKAIELGVDYVEIDLRTTRDGKFVSVHNSDVDSYCSDGTTGKVADFTLAELKALDIGSRVGPNWKDERIPTFEEILELCKGHCGIYLDFKNAQVEPVVAILREHGMAETTLWYASPAELEKVKQTCPECIPMPDPLVPMRVKKVLDHFHPIVVAATWDHLTKDYVDACHAAGAKIIVDDDGPETWDQMLVWGVDGIQTDEPAELVKHLQDRQGHLSANHRALFFYPTHDRI